MTQYSINDFSEDTIEDFDAASRYVANMKNAIIEISGSFLSKHPELAEDKLVADLLTKDYCPARAKEIAGLLRDAAEHAFERAVFVVTDRLIRVIPHESASLHLKDITTADALITFLQNREKEYFTDTLWYPDSTYKDDMERQKWHQEIVTEIAPRATTLARDGFREGLKVATQHYLEKKQFYTICRN